MKLHLGGPFGAAGVLTSTGCCSAENAGVSILYIHTFVRVLLPRLFGETAIDTLNDFEVRFGREQKLRAPGLNYATVCASNM